MALDVGRLLGDVGTLGVRYFKRQKKAKKKEKEAQALIAANTALAQEQYDRDLGTSQWDTVRADPALRAAQDRSLARLEGLSREGFTNLDRQALDQAFRQSQREEQSNRAAVMDAAARRGDVSGGNALMGALAAEQGGADRASQYATDIGLAGRERALDALEAYGSQAGDMRAQDVSEQGARAAGNDSFKQWATGQQFNAAQSLMNARLGQSQSLQQQAADMRSSDNIQAVTNAGLMAFQAKQGGGGGSAPVSSTPAATAPTAGPSAPATGRVQAPTQSQQPQATALQSYIAQRRRV